MNGSAPKDDLTRPCILLHGNNTHYPPFSGRMFYNTGTHTKQIHTFEHDGGSRSLAGAVTLFIPSSLFYFRLYYGCLKHK